MSNQINKNKYKSPFYISIIIACVIILFGILNIGQIFDLKLLDWKFVLRGDRPVSDKVFVVAMGDESISPEALGRWPWRRIYMAILIDIVKTYNPSSLIFDILFTEPSEDFPGDDEAFAEQASIINKVLFPFYCIPESKDEFRGYNKELQEINKKLIQSISLGNASDFKNKNFIDAKHLVMPIPLFSSTTKGSGYVNAIPDNDGVTRRVPLIMKYKDHLLPSIAFYSVLNYLGIKKEDIIIKPGKHIILKRVLGNIKLPVDKKCQMLVNHPGKFVADNISMVSFVGLIASHEALVSGQAAQFDVNKLKDKIIYVGLTATGTSDLRPTPFTPLFPMVGFQAAITSNIIEGDFLKPIARWGNYMIILILGLVAAFITVRFKAIPSAILNSILIIIYMYLNFVFFKLNYVISAFYPLLAIVLNYSAITMYRFTGEEKEKKIIRGTFQRYVSSQVVDVLLEHPEDIKLGGERKRLTVFFSDIRGFTTMSENLQPEEVVGILNEYLTEMIDIIFEYNGTLDKFIGDAVMAVWGAPVKQENHAELAVKAAWAMKNKITQLRNKWESEGKRKIGVGMGINTGDVVVGNMGSDQFADYTVIGDNVNLAARLEENAGVGQLIISESTYNEVKNIVEVKLLEPLKVKGKEKAVKVYEVIGIK